MSNEQKIHSILFENGVVLNLSYITGVFSDRSHSFSIPICLQELSTNDITQTDRQTDNSIVDADEGGYTRI